MRAPLVLLLLAATPLAAQEINPWRISDFPYLMGDPTNGLMLIGHIQYGREADYLARIPYDGYLSAEGGLGSRGSRMLTGRLRLPNLVKSWRFAADVGAVREGRFGYYGQGPQGQGALADELDRPTDFFRVRRDRYYLRGEVTRQLHQRLYASAAAGITHFRYSATKASDAFRADFCDTSLTGTDAMGRLTLILDTRDREFVPTKGLLFEAGIYAGSGKFEQRNPVTSFSGSGYTGLFAHLRGYFSPRGGTTLAGRVALRSLGANAPLDARYRLPGWEREVAVLGGADSQRGVVKGRYVGRGLFLASFEVRHNLIDVGDYGAITIVAFLDAGRMYQGGPSISLSNLKTGGGGAVAIRVIRTALLTFNFATGPDGFTFSMGNGWAF